MGEPPSLLDPFALWRDLVSQLEKGANELANQGMKSDQFASGMNKAMGASLVTRKMTKELMTRYCEALNLPTRSDIEALGERLQTIEDRMVGMAAALDRLAGGKVVGNAGLSAPAAPARTRKPPPEPVTAAPLPVMPHRAPPKSGKARA